MSVAQVLLERLKRNMAASGETPTKRIVEKQKNLTEIQSEKVLKIGALVKQASVHCEEEAEPLPAPNR